MRFDVNARSLSLSLSRQPLGQGERLVRFDVISLSLSLVLSLALSLSLSLSLLSRSLSLSLSRLLLHGNP